MLIEGNNIVLRSIEPCDVDCLYQMITSESIANCVTGKFKNITYEEHLNWFNNLKSEKNTLRLMIVLKTSLQDAFGEVIITDIDNDNKNAQIHIKILDGIYRNKGYGTESLSLTKRICKKNLNLHMLYAYILETNIISQKLFEKNNFIKDGCLIDRVYRNNSYINLLSYYCVL